MATLYIFVILLFRIVQAIFSKRSSLEIKNITMLLGYISFKNCISAILGIFLILISTDFKINLLTILISLFSGLSMFAASACGVYALKSGTIALNSMFATSGMIIPILAGVFLFNKPITILQIVGLGLFLISAYLLIGDSKSIYSNFNFKTFLLLIGTTVSEGCTMLAQQLFTAYVPQGNISIFSFITFSIVTLLSGITYRFAIPFNKIKNNNSKLSKNLIISGIALAIAVFVINQFATMSTKLVSPVILFALINGGGTIIQTIVASVIYKEKISKITATGIIIGILSLIIIKVF